jgi:hypothetical protein
MYAPQAAPDHRVSAMAPGGAPQMAPRVAPAGGGAPYSRPHVAAPASGAQSLPLALRPTACQSARSPSGGRLRGGGPLSDLRSVCRHGTVFSCERTPCHAHAGHFPPAGQLQQQHQSQPQPLLQRPQAQLQQPPQLQHQPQLQQHVRQPQQRHATIAQPAAAQGLGAGAGGAVYGGDGEYDPGWRPADLQPPADGSVFGGDGWAQPQVRLHARACQQQGRTRRPQSAMPSMKPETLCPSAWTDVGSSMRPGRPSVRVSVCQTMSREGWPSAALSARLASGSLFFL